MTYQLWNVSGNAAGWLDRPLLTPDAVALSSADLEGAGGNWTFFELYSRSNGERLAHLEISSLPGQEVFPSRTQLDSEGHLWVSVYVQNDALTLFHLDSQGHSLETWRWTAQDYSDLAAFDMACKLFPGPIGWVGGRPYVSWMYRQGRSYQMATPESAFAQAWPLYSGEGWHLVTDDRDLWALNDAGERLWIREDGQLLGLDQDWLAVLTSEGTAITLVDRLTGDDLETVSLAGWLRSFGGFAGEHMALAWTEQDQQRYRIHCRLPNQNWELSFPGKGAAWIGYDQEHSWWCDDKYWHCRNEQGKSLLSAAWPAGFRGLGYGPRICDRGLLWPNAVLADGQLWARYDQELLRWEL